MAIVDGDKAYKPSSPGADHNKEKRSSLGPNSSDGADVREGVMVERDNADNLQRHLGNRHIQLIAIGGGIGTALFVSIGTGLQRGGPLGLFLGYLIQSIMVGLVVNGLAEMTCYMPISGAFIRFAGNWVDDAFGFVAGWNFFFYEAFLIPFEIAALTLVLGYWRDDIPPAAICVACIVLYGLLNVVAVQYFGEAEFWLASGKLLLLAIVFSFTFVTMVGGNPQNDAYGFRYWNNPGPMGEYIGTGSLGQFQGFLAALYSACFTVVGPEYLSMVAGEAKRPRTYIKAGFKAVYWRFGCFFIGGALAVSIILPYTDPKLDNAGSGTAEGSPYVIAMQNMGISVLPDLVNALLLTSIFSAGNAYTYCSMRALYGLALQGQAPRFLTKCLGNGIPIYCFGIVMLFPFISFLQVSSSTAEVITHLQSLTSASGLINYIVIGTTFIFFHRACKAQGVDRRTLPYFGYLQPWGAYIGTIWMVIMVLTFGYTTFLPGRWDTLTFFSYYLMVIAGVLFFFGWKIWHKTKFVKPHEADLVWDKPFIDHYESQFTMPPSRFRDDIRNVFRRKKSRTHNDDIDPATV